MATGNSQQYISLTFKLNGLANKPAWDGDKTSRLKLFMRNYKPTELTAGEFGDLDLGVSFRFNIKSGDRSEIKEEMALMLESPLGKLNMSVFFPDDGALILTSPDIDMASLKPGDLIAYAYPIYSMHPDIKMEM